MSTQTRPLIECRTSLSPAEVLAAAKRFFARRNSIYAAFVEQESPTHVTMRGQGGEELVIGVAPSTPGTPGTRVTGSTYIFDFPLQRFFSTLPPAAEATA
jgi:hypothetical protein